MIVYTEAQDIKNRWRVEYIKDEYFVINHIDEKVESYSNLDDALWHITKKNRKLA